VLNSPANGPRDDLLVWIDLEMTGLDPQQNTIVEIATLITDNQLEVVAEGPEIIVHTGPEHIARMIPIVRDMHTRSGLIEKVRLSSVNLKDAERETLGFLKAWVRPRSAPLCGNSIWCDRMFLKLQMPTVDDLLHYRTIDVSSFKEVATRWNVAAIANAPRKADKHRALEDIRESIAQLKHYRDQWLAPARKKVEAKGDAKPDPKGDAKDESRGPGAEPVGGERRA